MEEPDASRRLAVYGSLRPGESNHREVRDLAGEWRSGAVHGHLQDQGWGSMLGYPGIVLDPQGPLVPVMLLTSSDLPEAWSRLDDFEGPGYRRTVVTVELDDGSAVRANIYEVRRGS